MQNNNTVSHNDLDIFSCDFRQHCAIVIIFGRNVTEKTGNQKILCEIGK